MSSDRSESWRSNTSTRIWRAETAGSPNIATPSAHLCRSGVRGDGQPDAAAHELPHRPEGVLLDYPKATLPNADSFLYWQDAKFGLKPTIRINHLTITDEQSHTAVVSKMLYASHYFWTAIELRVLIPDPARGEGFWFVNVNQSRSDGLGGFKGSVIRGKVRGEAEKGMQSALKITKTRMEH
jgi:hypothetical protein